MTENRENTFQVQARRVFDGSGLTFEKFCQVVGISTTTLQAWLAPPGSEQSREPNVMQRRTIRLLDERPEIWLTFLKWYEEETGKLPEARKWVPGAKLTTKDIVAIRRRRKKGEQLRTLALEYDVPESRISRLCNPPKKREIAPQAQQA